jgi:hypothetical protein
MMIEPARAPCAHHWKIGPPSGPVQHSVCVNGTCALSLLSALSPA